MRFANGRDGCDVGQESLAQFADLAAPVDPHLRDEDFGARHDPVVDGAREAEQVIEACRARDHRIAAVKQCRDVTLG